MRQLTPCIYPLFVLACIAASWWLTHSTRSTDNAIGNERTALAELIALRVTNAFDGDGFDALDDRLASLRERYPEIRSIGVVHADGTSVLNAGPHEVAWHPMDSDDKPFDQAVSTILIDGQPWGQTQVTFTPRASASATWWSLGTFTVIGILCLAILVRLFARRRFSRRRSALPGRVKAMLDTIAESVMILDTSQRIVFANATFADHVGMQRADLQGMSCNDLHWISLGDGKPATNKPWTMAMDLFRKVERARIGIVGREEQARSYVVNCVPITDHKQRAQGVLVSLSDVTVLEIKQAELEAHVSLLDDAREEILQKNTRLRHLAHHDPLTGCLNRRAFLEQAADILDPTQRQGQHLGCVMLDIDHFKAVNDTHGHPVGDAILAAVAQTLLGLAQTEDLVCRWGGEEFCILLAVTDAQECLNATERFRTEVAARPFGGVSVTASCGIATCDAAVGHLESLIDRADQALYASKHNGRNRSTLWSTNLNTHESGRTQDANHPKADVLPKAKAPKRRKSA